MTVRAPKYVSSGFVKVIKRLTLPWYALTTLLYFIAIPMTIWVFPATTLILSVFVLFGGFTASMASLASAMITADQDKALASLEDEVTPDDEHVVPEDELDDNDKENDDAESTTHRQAPDQGGAPGSSR